MNLASIPLSHALSRPDHPAIEENSTVLTHAESARRIGAFASLLAHHSIARGDRVGLCLRDTGDHLLLHYAIAWLGATIVPIDHRWTETEKSAIAAAFACKRVIVEASDPAASSLPALPFDPAWRETSLTPPPMADDETLPVLLSLSSGTTGRPTGALVSHRELYERFSSQWVGFSFNSADRYLMATPLYFGGGRSFAMSFLAAGATIVCRPPPAEAEELIAMVRARDVTIAFFVPTQIRRLLDAWHGVGLAMPSLRRLITSGAAIQPQERERALAELSPGLTDYYATSEGGGIAILPPHEQLAFPNSVGRAAFRVEIEVIGDDGKRQPPGTVGRLRYRGPGVSTRLINATGATVDADPEGWFMPGDLARILPSGHIELVGRVKDVIIRAGVNIYPAEIEAVLSTHPAIAEASVFGIPDRELGEAVAAALVLRPGQVLDDVAAKDFLRQRLAPYKLPQHIVVVRALPRNPSGKVIRAELLPLLS
jgi:acyl-CoA synthetase (AMP-forming)/AMP-acid ligase II